ncbi:aminotransferase class I/II-fold pyridoxal phosphate-dependent enzyme, partial [Vibrio caribbeanicus]|uniref:aminotransferase class I/II-fold pyridoxal phosphate-dependent enzyme n=1 Tax=Vibrio caribbeanicus TaxID=701175 RepID=UPI0030D81E6D
QKCQFLSTLAVSAPVQEGIADYLKYSSYDNHLRKLRKKLHQYMDCFYINLVSQLPDTTIVNRPDGGYFIWVQFPSHINTEKLYYKLLEQDISVAYGELFAFYKSFESCLRVNVSQVPMDEISSVVAKIAQLIK